MLIVVVALCQRCANIVTPSGGPKDVRPPMVVDATPANKTLNFTGHRVDIVFDEFVVLENANQNIVISPPLTQKADVKLHDKVLIIKFKEQLKPNTTYTISFGDAIKDFHEGNAFKGYVHSFSTGCVLDTLSIGGVVLDAENKKPIDGVKVGLYAADTLYCIDSLPLLRAPDYIAKTDKDGNFIIDGLPKGEFLVFALDDANSNLFFDLPNEKVAFLDTLVSSYYAGKTQRNVSGNLASLDSLSILVYDSLGILSYDSLGIPSIDSIAMADLDSVARAIIDQRQQPKKIMAGDKPLGLTLFMFQEQDSIQQLLEKKVVDDGLLRFVFKYPAPNAVVTPCTPLADSMTVTEVVSKNHDTIWWYYTPKAMDSLWIKVCIDTMLVDSSRYNLTYKPTKKQLGSQEPRRMNPKNILSSETIMPGKSYVLCFDEPLAEMRLRDTITLKEDTISYYNIVSFEKADDYGFRYRLTHNLKPGSSYRLQIPDSVFFGARGFTNDTLRLDFRMGVEEEYGSIFITVVPPHDVAQVVVQLFNSSNKMVASQAINQEQEVSFWSLVPGKYKIKALLDADANGCWSSGNYRHRVLPEMVLEYPQDLEVKANWDIDLEEKWNLDVERRKSFIPQKQK